MNTPISTSSFQHDSLTELLRWRASTSPDKRIYSFLHDGETESEYLTFSTLDQQARNIGAWLQEHSKSGERALLIYPSGLDFIAAFYACLYSGVIAVPVYPPSATRADRTLQRFYAIAKDAQPDVILTTSSLSSRVESLVASSPDLQKAHLLVTNELQEGGEEQWQQSAITGDTLAFLQYTSGSTGMPKGVMVSHRNLLHNSAMIADVCRHPTHARLVTWLPLYHDLGLIGGIIQPLYVGFESTILSPTVFLQRPIRWLQAISRFKATMTGAPNFAYDLCVRKITPEQRETLDLSSLEVAANGAEPVRAETLEQFYNTFASCGLRREALYPCYGLAESTLFAGGRPHGTAIHIETFKNTALEQNKAEETTSHETGTTSLVSLGTPLPQQTLFIVNTETFTKCADERVGEIWLASPSVAQGYWRKATETSETFHAYLADTGEGPFLRTGDLGFLHHGELFITGRLKDLIIIRGSNHYPQDIEQTVEKSHRALKPGSGVAFSVDADGEERLVIVQEVERQYLKSNLQEVVDSIRLAVAEQHELQTYTVVLLKPAVLPKTSSGKVQRRASKESFLDGSLESVYTWMLNRTSPSTDTTINDANGKTGQDITQQESVSETGKSRDEIQVWLTTQIAERLKVNRREVDIREPFAYYGMDSVQAVSLSADLEDWLERELSPTLAYEYPTIEALARYLAGEAISPVSLLAPRTEQAEDRQAKTETATDAIAIIGLGCRFPGADSPESFWQMLREGRDGITEVPIERWNAGTYYDPEQAVPGKMNTRWGGFLSHVDSFDPYFFGISPREAERMDPQQRLLLEVAWETLENAGQSSDRLAGSQTGVFVGISGNDYARWLYDDPDSLDAYTGTGNAHSIAANRLSYVLDLRGPSIAVDTACSSSLVSVHMACQSIRNGECDMALAGGVNLILTPELTITFSQARMMSSEGHCKTFDDSADGYVRSEGCGLVLLKPLSQALKDGDTVLAVIRGSAVNQDGRSNGLTAPNALAQEAVILQALQNAHVTPEQISYVEAHGSSTPLGDPIEFNALKAVLMPNRTHEQPCIVSSVKTNIGHLESAAGIAGLIKTVLSLYHEEIPPHLHFKKLNQHISLDGTSFVIPTQRQQWPDTKRRIAGVSAFGFGGTNAHIIVEAAPPQATSPRNVQKMERPLHLLTLSAKSESALRTLAQQYANFLTDADTSKIADICFTANTGRAHFAHRLAITGDSAQQLRERLLEAAAGLEGQGIQHGQVQGKERTKVAFLFSGQGSQYVGMGRHLYETQPTFRHALDECDRILQAYLDGDSRDKSRHNMGERSLLSVLYGDEHSTLLNETAYTQPALFALEYALAQLWRSWGLVPDAVMGHSVGEYVAACVAGLFSLEDALKLIAERGRLMQALPQNGEMLSVFATEEQIASVIAPYSTQVAIAAINGPQHIVLSGERAAIEAIKQQLEAKGVTTYPMTVSHAFHSPLMEPMLNAFEQVARSIQTKPLRILLVANLTGRMVNIGETLDAAYWRRQTRSAVQFSAGIQTLAEQGYTCFVEVGPATTLLGMAKRCLAGTDAAQDVIWLSSLHKNQDDWETLLNDVGMLYVKGVERVIGHDATRGVDSGYSRKRIVFPALPTYPFERERYWHVGIDVSRPTTTPTGYTDERHELWPRQVGRHPLLDTHTELVYPLGTHVWETTLDGQRLPYLKDHRIQGAMAAPISLYIEMAQAAATEALGTDAHVLKDIELKKLLLLPEHGTQKVQVVLASEANNDVSFSVYSHVAGVPEQPRQQWTLHASGKIFPSRQTRMV